LKGGERLKKQIKGINWRVKVLDEANRIIEMIGSSEDYDRVGGKEYGGYLSRGIINKIANRVDGLLLLCPAVIADFKKRNIPKHSVSIFKCEENYSIMEIKIKY
jgi:hypothetical protein